MLEFKEAVKRYDSGGMFFKGKSLTALDALSLEVERGEFFSLVGESGCGKSTLARIVAGLENLDDGEFYLDGERITNIGRFKNKDLRRRVQMIFQDPYSSLNPRMTVEQLLEEPLVSFGWGSRTAIADRLSELADIIRFPKSALTRYPHQFSGGQRQRIAIARALAASPELLICDEPVSALDVSIKGQIVNLLIDIQANLGVTILFISHDLSLVSKISDRVGVMYLGKIIEVGDARNVFEDPRHPYTRLLLDSVPSIARSRRHEQSIPMGEVPSPFAIPTACRFRDRCPLVFETCAQMEPELLPISPVHRAACHLRDQPNPPLSLQALEPLRGMDLFSSQTNSSDTSSDHIGETT